MLFRSTSIGTPPGPSNVTPEQIKRGAQLLDTYANALQAGVAAISIRAGAPLPETSSGLVALAPRYRLDAWGRPFCFVRLAGRVAVISAGPGKGAYAGCKEIWESTQGTYRAYHLEDCTNTHPGN